MQDCSNKTKQSVQDVAVLTKEDGIRLHKNILTVELTSSSYLLQLLLAIADEPCTYCNKISVLWPVLSKLAFFLHGHPFVLFIPNVVRSLAFHPLIH